MRILAGIALALSIAAPTPAVAQDTGPPVHAADSSRFEVVYITRATERRITMGVPIFALVGALSRMEVEVSNPTGSERRFEYLIEWYGRDGAKAQTSAMWRSLYLLPNERQTLRSVAQLEQAYRARLTIRETSRRPS